MKTRQTIQIGSGKLNTSREKHFLVVIARNPFSEQTYLETN
jgi:hypothetical protein